MTTIIVELVKRLKPNVKLLKKYVETYELRVLRTKYKTQLIVPCKWCHLIAKSKQ